MGAVYPGKTVRYSQALNISEAQGLKTQGGAATESWFWEHGSLSMDGWSRSSARHGSERFPQVSQLDSEAQRHGPSSLLSHVGDVNEAPGC